MQEEKYRPVRALRDFWWARMRAPVLAACKGVATFVDLDVCTLLCFPKPTLAGASRRGIAYFALPFILAFLALSAGASAASASVAAPSWSAQSRALPTAFSAAAAAAGNDAYEVNVQNIGTGPSAGPIKVVDELPPGVTTSQTPEGGEHDYGALWICVPTGSGATVVTCETSQVISPANVAYNEEKPSDYENGTRPLTYLNPIVIPVNVSSGASGTLTNKVTVSGAGAADAASTSAANPVNLPASPSFGFAGFQLHVIGEEGLPYTQAGGHPYALTTSFQFASELVPGATNAATGEGSEYRGVSSGDQPRTVVAELPLGLIGDPAATPRCPVTHFAKGDNLVECAPDTRVGVAYIQRQSFGEQGAYQLYNLTPEAGHAAEFGLSFGSFPIVFYGDVAHTARGYVLRVTALLPQAQVSAVSLTFFGEPARAFSEAFSAAEAEAATESAFLTNPVDCGASEAGRAFELYADSWAHPGLGDPFLPVFSGEPNWAPAQQTLPAVEGCESLAFTPSLSFQPASTSEGGTSQTDEPSGYNVNLEVPQTESYSELATPELKTATVVLPAGLSVSPSAANGLVACTNVEIALESSEPGSCPLGSQLGTVTITTPLLEEALEGEVFLGEPECSPCSEADASEGKTFHLFIQVHSEKLGVTIKLPGIVKANPANGQLTAEFTENPQLPFSDLELKFKDGPRAPLANPQTCGTSTTLSSLEPWSAPQTATVVSESRLTITGCGSLLAFNPGFAAGMASPQAGASSSLAVSFSRQDGEQDLGAITVNTPPGLLGKIAGVTKCGEAEANAGTCPAASLIGTSTVSAGPGSDPYTIDGGKVYLTGPYQDQPFGLSIVVPAEAGPFKLAGNTGAGLEVVRASIAINPATAALTVTSGALPQIIDGVPIRLRTVNVEINRAGFMRNATSCASQSIAATITGEHPIGSSEAAKASAVATPYAANGCASLPFDPKLTASTSGKTSHKEGASLIVKIAYPAEGEANVRRVHVQLPSKLPARQSTLANTCPEAMFDANPASCPPLAVIGSAKAITPLLNVPLEGPAYYVSHGGAAFPEIVAVLQGEGVTIELHGETYISPKGIITSTFASVPDAPISSFQLTLPQGSDSVLGANNGNVCKGTLSMPTVIDGQNGAQIEQDTKIKATGCEATVQIKSRKVSGKTLTVKVQVPSAGKLKVSGKGIRSATKKAGKAKLITLKLKLTSASAARYAKGEKVKTKFKLTFTPTKGKTITKSLTVTFKASKKQKQKANQSRRAK